MKLKNTDALYDVIKQHEYILSDRCNSTDYGMFTIGIKQVIDELPAIDATPVVHGWWTAVEEHSIISENVVNEWVNFYCSECDAPSSNPSNYCPNCGAKMDG